MNKCRRSTYGVVATLLMGLSACQPTPPPAPKGYFGPTDTIRQVVEKINQNNSQLPTIWARQSFEAWPTDPRDRNKTDFLNGDGTLLYSSPASIRMTGSKEVADLFDLGSDGTRFWLFEKHNDIFHWGTFADLDKPGARKLPIRPDVILEVLGIRPINPVLLDEPFPVMRFNNDADVYMLVWHVRGESNYIAQKEIWYDRQTLHPKLVLLDDANGRVVLRARLSDYTAVKVENESEEKWPQMATHFELFFPDDGTRMNFTLRSLVLSHNGYPKPISFQMPNPEELRKNGIKIIPIHEENGP